MFDYFGAALAVLVTLGLLSYVLVGNTGLFRTLLALFVGVTAGYIASVVVRYVLAPRLLEPLRVRHWLVLTPFVFVLLLFLHRTRLSFAATPVLALLTGVAAATLVAGTVLGTLFPQIQATWQAWRGTGGLTPLQGIVVWLLVIFVLTVFFYRDPGHLPAALRWPLRAAQALGNLALTITLAVLVLRLYQTALMVLGERLWFLWQTLNRLIFG